MLYLNCSQNGLFCPCNKQFVDEAPVQMEALSVFFMSEHGEASLCVPDLAVYNGHFKLLLTQREPS